MFVGDLAPSDPPAVDVTALVLASGGTLAQSADGAEIVVGKGGEGRGRKGKCITARALLDIIEGVASG